jgi:hypothetical protein
LLHADNYIHKNKIINSVLKLDFPIYHFEIGDIDNNGKDDIAVGVIKQTYYDSIERKRPFFYKLNKGYLRPLWLGSRLSHPLENFRIKKVGAVNYLQSIEIERNGNYMVCRYSWNGFGFRFINYLCRNKNKSEAYKIFEE